MIAAAFGERSRPFYGQPRPSVLPDLVAASDGHPQRAMLLAHLLWSRVPAGQVATPAMWSETISEALRRIDVEARTLLGGLTPGERKALRAVAEYGSPLNTRALRALDLAKTTARQAANVLLAQGVLERDEQGWQVVDPLLARWIRHELGTRTQL